MASSGKEALLPHSVHHAFCRRKSASPRSPFPSERHCSLCRSFPEPLSLHGSHGSLMPVTVHYAGEKTQEQSPSRPDSGNSLTASAYSACPAPAAYIGEGLAARTPGSADLWNHPAARESPGNHAQNSASPLLSPYSPDLIQAFLSRRLRQPRTVISWQPCLLPLREAVLPRAEFRSVRSSP